MINHLARYKIRVNAVSPGSITTKLWDSVSADDAFWSELSESNPLGRISTSVEVAHPCVTLTEDKFQYLNENFLYPDGGRRWRD